MCRYKEYGKTLGGRMGSQHTVWEVMQRMIDALMNGNGGQGAAARDLAYRLYTICDRKGWSGLALP